MSIQTVKPFKFDNNYIISQAILIHLHLVLNEANQTNQGTEPAKMTSTQANKIVKFLLGTAKMTSSVEKYRPSIYRAIRSNFI